MSEFAAGLAMTAFVFLIALVARKYRRRRRTLAWTAARLDLGFITNKEGSVLLRQFDRLELLNGSQVETENHFVGLFEGRQVLACDLYRSRSDSYAVKEAFVLIQTPLPASHVRIERRRWGLMATLFPRPELALPLTPFTRRYRVVSDDPRFAQDLLDPALTAFMMRHPRWDWEIHRDVVAMRRRRRLWPKELAETIATAGEFVGLVQRSKYRHGAAGPTQWPASGFPTARPII